MYPLQASCVLISCLTFMLYFCTSFASLRGRENSHLLVLSLYTCNSFHKVKLGVRISIQVMDMDESYHMDSQLLPLFIAVGSWKQEPKLGIKPTFSDVRWLSQPDRSTHCPHSFCWQVNTMYNINWKSLLSIFYLLSTSYSSFYHWWSHNLTGF